MILWSEQRDDREGGKAVWVCSVLTAAVPVSATATLVPFAEHGSARAALVTAAGAGVTVNGFPPLGVTVLEERDEIVAGGVRLLFTHYAPAEPALLPAAAAGARCSRCLVVLRAGDLCVRCPACRAYAHEEDTRPCWTYDPRTGCCGHSRAAFVWTPADGGEDER